MSSTQHDDVVISGLKARYFDLLRKEDIPNTPKVTAEADRLEEAIRRLKSQAVERGDY